MTSKCLMPPPPGPLDEGAVDVHPGGAAAAEAGCHRERDEALVAAHVEHVAAAEPRGVKQPQPGVLVKAAQSAVAIVAERQGKGRAKGQAI